jgi:hypothetical protein
VYDDGLTDFIFMASKDMFEIKTDGGVAYCKGVSPMHVLVSTSRNIRSELSNLATKISLCNVSSAGCSLVWPRPNKAQDVASALQGWSSLETKSSSFTFRGEFINLEETILCIAFNAEVNKENGFEGFKALMYWQAETELSARVHQSSKRMGDHINALVLTVL